MLLQIGMWPHWFTEPEGQSGFTSLLLVPTWGEKPFVHVFPRQRAMVYDRPSNASGTTMVFKFCIYNKTKILWK